MPKAPLTVVVIAKNEEENMADCLGSVKGWADEIVVVDDQSTDRTVEISKRYTDRVLHRKMDNEGTHRNWAAAQARNEWVLFLDADERVTPELQQEISETLPSTTHAVFAIPLRTYIGTYWVYHSGWYPGSKVRMVKKSVFKYEEAKVHPRILCEGTCGHLKKDIIHYGYPDLEHFLQSLNRQRSEERRVGKECDLACRSRWSPYH
jgi:glycosyltransferase involved in cell wall biosynthesis